MHMKKMLKKIGLLAFSVMLMLLGLEGFLRVVPLANEDNPMADRSSVFYRQALDRAHP